MAEELKVEESKYYKKEDTTVEGYTHFHKRNNDALNKYNKDFLLVKLPYNIDKSEEIRKVFNRNHERPILVDANNNLLLLSTHTYKEWTTKNVKAKNKGSDFDITLVHHNNSIKVTYRKILRDLRKLDLSNVEIAYSTSNFNKVSIYSNNKLSIHNDFNCMEEVLRELNIDKVNGCSYNPHRGMYNPRRLDWLKKFDHAFYLRDDLE